MSGKLPARSRRPRRDLRATVSRRVNALVFQALRRSEIVDRVGGRAVNLAMTLRRWQLSFIEHVLIDALRRREMRARGARVDVSALRPRKERRAFLARTRNRIRTRTSSVLKAGRLWLLKRLKRNVCAPGVRRLMLVDGKEIKRSRIGGRRYVYHKYLEGLVDFDGLQIDEDVLVVLYGDLRDVPRSVLHHPRVVILALFGHRRTLAPLLARASLVAGGCHESYFHGVPMSLELRRRVSAKRRLLEDLMRDDLRLIAAVDALLSHFSGPLEITLDNYDSTLFAVSQHLLQQHTAHTVVAIQKVLGPYTFSFNIRGHGGLFRTPHRILVWGSFHRRRLERLGYDCEIRVESTYRIPLYRDLVASGRTHTRDRVEAALGVRGVPVVMFSVVGHVLDFPLIDPMRYLAMLQDLAALANAGRCFVVFKPWPGEDVGVLKSLMRALFERGTFRLVDAAFNARFHNLELLLAADVVISTVSSFLGEALALGSVPVLVTSRSAEWYFSREYTRQFRRFCSTVDEHVPLSEVLAPLLDRGARGTILGAVDAAFVELFGDGA